MLNKRGNNHFFYISIVPLNVVRLNKFIKLIKTGSSCGGSEVTNLTRIHEDLGLLPGLTQWVKYLVSPWAVVWIVYLAQIRVALAVA